MEKLSSDVKMYIALLIAKAIKAIGVHEVDPKSIEFRIMVQKIAYIMSRLKILPRELEFQWFSRGPYNRVIASMYNQIAELVMSKYMVMEGPRDEEIEKLMEFLEKLSKACNRGIDYVLLETVSSLMMLCRDVYPRIENPVEELIKRKPYLERDLAKKVYDFLLSEGLCS